MKIRKIITNLFICTLLAAGQTQICTALPAKAAADGGFTAAQIEASTVKPTLSASRISLTAAQAPSSVQTVAISIKGADSLYSSSGFHVYIDSRLTLIPNEWGCAATKGDAISDLSTESYSKDNCIFLTSAGQKGLGKDGIMWKFSVKLPENAKAGDIYPIKIVYEKGKKTEDVFINDYSDKSSRLMQAWIFTRGIQHGYIQVGDYTPGDANCNGITDLSDAVLIMQSISAPGKYGISGTDNSRITSQGCKNADVNALGDGVTAKDALSIQKYTLKLISSLPES